MVWKEDPCLLKSDKIQAFGSFIIPIWKQAESKYILRSWKRGRNKILTLEGWVGQNNHYFKKALKETFSA